MPQMICVLQHVYEIKEALRLQLVPTDVELLQVLRLHDESCQLLEIAWSQFGIDECQ